MMMTDAIYAFETLSGLIKKTSISKRDSCFKKIWNVRRVVSSARIESNRLINCYRRRRRGPCFHWVYE